MFTKFLKWLNSDRSEEPREIVADIPSPELTRLRDSARLRFHADLDEVTMREVVRLVQKRQKIEAIKLVRETTDHGLKESKDVVDHLEELLKRSN